MAANVSYTTPKPAYDVFAPTIPQPFGLPDKPNLWRVGNTVIVYENRTWKRYAVDTPEAVVWRKILGGSWQSYNYWTTRLVAYVQAQRVAKIITLVQPAKTEVKAA